MKKISKFKYWILSVFSSAIGCTAYYFLEKERLIKEAAPYPALYDAVKKECPALLKGNKYVNKTTRDNGLSISGESDFQYNGENRRFRMAVLRKRFIVFFKEVKVDERGVDLKTDDNEAITIFDTDDVKFSASSGGTPEPDNNFKKAFEKEMIERLKSCEK